jgi:hypothetical protein
MIDAANVPEVVAGEWLARFIFYSNHFRPGDKTVKPNAFLPPASLLCSVTRHYEATENELWSVGEAVASMRGVTLYGRADVQAETCIRQRLMVSKDPITENPNHANIRGWPADKPAQKIIAQELAAAAALVLQPEPEGP